MSSDTEIGMTLLHIRRIWMQGATHASTSYVGEAEQRGSAEWDLDLFPETRDTVPPAWDETSLVVWICLISHLPSAGLAQTSPPTQLRAQALNSVAADLSLIHI